MTDEEAKSYQDDYNEESRSTKKVVAALATRLGGEAGQLTRRRERSKPSVSSSDRGARRYSSTQMMAAIQAWGTGAEEGGSRRGYHPKKHAATLGKKSWLKIFFSQVN